MAFIQLNRQSILDCREFLKPESMYVIMTWNFLINTFDCFFGSTAAIKNINQNKSFKNLKLFPFSTAR